MDDLIKGKIYNVWEDYIGAKRAIYDLKGNSYKNIDFDNKRLDAIKDIKTILSLFYDGSYDLATFKTTLDGYNKRNNFWGFPAAKGQMYFNLLTKASQGKLDALTELLKDVIKEPVDINDAIKKIERLELFTIKLSEISSDKRKSPNPSSVGYFLSYFWQICNPIKWPIIYTSIIESFKALNFGGDENGQSLNYKKFFLINEDIKRFLSIKVNENLTNWDIEHCFWYFKGRPQTEPSTIQIADPNSLNDLKNEPLSIKANFNIYDYIIPKVSKLIEIGEQEGMK
ncbi:hypothetical protein [Mucilaginibacter lappiensis]|uniref:hypothetical protein n=1 Tax=Mucilaginibacter lappiensis TaxID=354630 RepID=UPI003D1AA3DA